MGTSKGSRLKPRTIAASTGSSESSKALGFPRSARLDGVLLHPLPRDAEPGLHQGIAGPQHRNASRTNPQRGDSLLSRFSIGFLRALERMQESVQ